MNFTEIKQKTKLNCAKIKSKEYSEKSKKEDDIVMQLVYSNQN